MNYQKALFGLGFIFLSLIFFLPAKAVCPACVVVVAGGLSLSEWLGIDDFVSALWIGGLSLSLVSWGLGYLKKKNKLNALNGIVVFLLIYASIIGSIYWMGLIGIPGNTVWGMDKILAGTVSGTIVFWLGTFFNSLLKKRNEGKVYFPFQKVVLPFSVLLIVSFAYYFLCKCF